MQSNLTQQRDGVVYYSDSAIEMALKLRSMKPTLCGGYDKNTAHYYKRKKEAWVALLAACLLVSAAAVAQMMPVLNDYFMTHLHTVNSDTKPKYAVTYTSTTYAVCIFMDPLAAYLQKRVNLRYLSLVAILVECAALIGAAFCTSYWQFLICYGALANSSAVLLLMVSLLSCWEWFPDVRGQVTGAILAC